MIQFFEFLSFLLAWGYTFVFFWIIQTFLPLRKNWILKIAAFIVCGYLADSIIYSNDLGSLFGTMLLFLAYVFIFYRGALIEKISVLLVFYPALIAVNYLMLDIGGRTFQAVTHSTYEEALQSPELMLTSTAIHTFSLFLASYICNATETAFRAQELEMQRNYFKSRIKDEERVRSVYHDMKNHLLVLESKPNTDETRQMAQELRTQIADYEDYVRTGNEFLDIIMKDKAEKAREKHIDFSVAIDFKDIDFIEPLDISTLFGNGIDNAIEACEKLREEDRVILVKAGRVQNFVSILIENNCVEEALTKGRRTTKADTLLHGFGLSNMQKAAEKYGGTCTTRREDGKFTLKILIPVPGGKNQ